MTSTPTWSDYSDFAEYDEDEALTRPIYDLSSSWSRQSDQEITGSVQIQHSFAADLTPEPLPAADLIPLTEPSLPEPPAVAYAPPAYPPASMPFAVTPPPHALLSGSTPLPRARLDSDVSTWQRTVPALRKRLQAATRPTPWDPTQPRRPAPLIPSVPPPAVTYSAARSASATPFVVLAAAVFMVALVVVSIVGLGARSHAAAALGSRQRDVSALAPDGTLVTEGRLLVDGAVICKHLPCSIELGEGSHWMTIAAAGFEAPPSRVVGASPDEPVEVQFRLTPKPAPAPVQTAPEPIQTPAMLPVAPPATVFDSPRQSPTRTLRSTASSASSTGHLNVNAIPPANVVVDGRPVGSTPVMGLTLPAGAHTVVLITSDGQRAVRSASVKAGKTAVVSTRF